MVPLKEYDLAVEEPYGGFALGVRPVGGAMVGYTNEGETDEELRTSAGLDFDLQGDLGYLLNISALADWYMHLRVGSLLPMGEWADMSDLFVIPTFDLGFEKRLYFGGTYLGIEADLSSQTWYNTYTDVTNYGGDVEFLQAFVGGGATSRWGRPSARRSICRSASLRSISRWQLSPSKLTEAPLRAIRRRRPATST